MMKAVIFDLDNTLYAYWPAHHAGFRALTDYARSVLGIEPEELSALHREGDRLLHARAGDNTAAVHNRLIRYQLMLEKRGLPICHAPRMERRYWDSYFAEMEPEPGTRETLLALRKRGLRIGIGTNMTASQQYTKLELLGLLELVDFIVCSEEVSAEKPDRRFFDCCVEKAGCLAEECLFVGDDQKRDVLAALDAGLLPVWLQREGMEAVLPPEIPRIRRIDELPALLEADDAWYDVKHR
jgi:putative hydrolase of the HAD superfamily